MEKETGSVEYTLNDLRWVGVREVNTEPTKEKTRLRNGREVPVTKLVTHVNTAGAGRIPLEVWYEYALDAVKRCGLEEDLQRHIQHAKTCGWLKSNTSCLHYALETMSNLGPGYVWPEEKNGGLKLET